MKDARTRQFFTTGHVATLCEVSPRTASKWIDGGTLVGFRLPGSQDRRVRRGDLVAFLREHGYTHALETIGSGYESIDAPSTIAA